MSNPTPNTTYASLPLELRQHILRHATKLPTVHPKPDGTYRPFTSEASVQRLLAQIELALNTLGSLIAIESLRPSLHWVAKQLQSDFQSLSAGYWKWRIHEPGHLDAATGQWVLGMRGSLRWVTYREGGSLQFLELVGDFVDGVVKGLGYEARGFRWAAFNYPRKYRFKSYLRQMRVAGKFLGEVSDDEDIGEITRKRKRMGCELPVKRVKRG